MRRMSPMTCCMGALSDADNLVDSLVHDGLWDTFNDYHIGASGCRILVSLAHEMVKRDARKGITTLYRWR